MPLSYIYLLFSSINLSRYSLYLEEGVLGLSFDLFSLSADLLIDGFLLREEERSLEMFDSTCLLSTIILLALEGSGLLICLFDISLLCDSLSKGFTTLSFLDEEVPSAFFLTELSFLDSGIT